MEKAKKMQFRETFSKKLFKFKRLSEYVIKHKMELGINQAKIVQVINFSTF